MRSVGLLGLRAVVGGYLAAHGAQKLFGALDGPGLAKAGAGFERMGLRPGKQFATPAAGLAHPLGPIMIAGSMAVASTAHAGNGPMSASGGYELPLTNLAAALTL